MEKVLILGGSGFIGSAVGPKLVENGYSIHLLTRSPNQRARSFPCREWRWDGHLVPEESLDGVNYVINLAGEGIADHFWTAGYKVKLRNSRILSTRALATALAKAPRPERVVIQASAIGYYGTRQADIPFTESMAPGSSGFLSELCQQWEKEANKMADHARLCLMRTGLVLGRQGGAFPLLWKIYRGGLGSVLGTGRQWMNWISAEDLCAFILKALKDPSCSGAYNLVTPQNCTNLEFHQELAKRSPSFQRLKTPGVFVKLLLGQRSQLLLEGPKIVPAKLLARNFPFKSKSLPEVLDALLLQNLGIV